MAKRHEIERHAATLRDIHGIMGAMKNLAFMEIHKLERFIATQQRVVVGIEEAAADFLDSYPIEMLPTPLSHKGGAKRGGRNQEAVADICVVIGSERAFCGDFNDTLLVEYETKLRRNPTTVAAVAVGGRLATRLADDTKTIVSISGATAVEEITMVLANLVKRLGELQRVCGENEIFGITALYHSHEAGEIRLRRMLPLMDVPKPPRHFSHAPSLNLAPDVFFSALTEQFLYAVLHEILYASFMAENRERLEHMDSAMRRLENETEQLKRKAYALRQEEITEEIEVIMLSADAIVSEQ